MDMHGADGLKYGQDLREGLQPATEENPGGNSGEDVRCCKFVAITTCCDDPLPITIVCVTTPYQVSRASHSLLQLHNYVYL